MIVDKHFVMVRCGGIYGWDSEIGYLRNRNIEECFVVYRRERQRMIFLGSPIAKKSKYHYQSSTYQNNNNKHKFVSSESKSLIPFI